MQFTKTLLVSSLFLWISTLEAFDGTSTPRPEQLKSAAWWREQAVRYTDEIADADARGRAHYALAYVLAGGGDLDAARASARKINNPQLRVYAHCFVAKTYKQKGDDNACLSELQEARKVALEWANISGHSAVIHAYVDMGYLAEAVAFASEIPADSPNRTYSLQETAAALAEKGHLDMALDLVEHRIPPIGKEGALSQMANACARKLRLQDVEKLTAQMTNAEFQNRAYVHLVEALVQADRLAEAASFADRISDPARKEAAQARIAAKTVKNDSAEALRSRVEKATTRDEKLAIYDVLFTKLVDAGDVAAAEAVIESMVKTIKASPRKPSPSKFGTFNDAVAVVMAQAKYLQTAKVLAQKSDRKGSLLRVAQARKAITDLPNEAGLGKFLLVAGLVRSEIEIGDLSGARSTLGQLKTDFNRSTAAADVAVALIKSGDVKSGLEVAEMIVAGPVGRGEAMGMVVSALLHAKEVQATKELLRKIGDTSDDAGAFRAAGATMMELGLGTELHQWVGEMTSNVARAYLCLGAADAKTRRP